METVVRYRNPNYQGLEISFGSRGFSVVSGFVTLSQEDEGRYASELVREGFTKVVPVIPTKTKDVEVAATKEVDA